MAKFLTILASSPVSVLVLETFIIAAVFGIPAGAKAVEEPEEIVHGRTPPPVHTYDDWKDWESWEAPSDVIEGFPYYKMGYDLDGLPVYAIDFGKWNHREWARKGEEKDKEFWKYFEQFVRRQERDARSNNEQGVVQIIDFDGFSLSHHASSKAIELALRMFTSMVRVNHCLKYGIFVNVNFGAETFINGARPFMGTMLEKFEVCGTRMAKCRPKLLSKVSADQLHPKYGGTNNDWKPVPFNT